MSYALVGPMHCSLTLAYRIILILVLVSTILGMYSIDIDARALFVDRHRLTTVQALRRLQVVEATTAVCKYR